MLSILLFISSGEIVIILLFVLLFFGADKIPDFTRMMGKGIREFRKATDDIKREFQESSSGIVNDIKSIGADLSDSLTKEIAEPLQTSANDASKSFDEFQEQYSSDFYYDNPYDDTNYGNEYKNEAQSPKEEETKNNDGEPSEQNSDNT